LYRKAVTKPNRFHPEMMYTCKAYWRFNLTTFKESAMAEQSDFLYPRSRYYGEFKPENLVFNANLQEFAQRVSYICNLETAGKLSSENAYEQIKDLWQQLKLSHQQLRIGENPFESSE